MAVNINRTASESHVTQLNTKTSEEVAGYSDDEYVVQKGTTGEEAIKLFVVWAEKDYPLVQWTY